MVALDSARTKFDAVVSSRDLEHCDDPRAVMAQMIAQLCRGGRIVITLSCTTAMRAGNSSLILPPW
jgi:2-polyprenyl-3-methyl-5-hydroxy-6-metoxy-1,4-benzoquinol methylase